MTPQSKKKIEWLVCLPSTIHSRRQVTTHVAVSFELLYRPGRKIRYPNRGPYSTCINHFSRGISSSRPWHRPTNGSTRCEDPQSLFHATRAQTRLSSPPVRPVFFIQGANLPVLRFIRQFFCLGAKPRYLPCSFTNQGPATPESGGSLSVSMHAVRPRSDK